MRLTTATTSTFKPVPLEWVEKLFEAMTACYGVRFLDMWRGVDMDSVKAKWATELGKLTFDELRRGHAALMQRDTPPSLPQFVKLCRAPIDPETAFYEAVEGMQARERGEMGKWSSPAIYWAAQRVGAYEMRTQSFAQIGGRFKTALEAILEGDPCPPIPEPLKSLPMPGKTALSRESAERMLAEIKASGVFRVAEDKRDPLAWAKKILKRVADGDKEISPLQKRFATEAIRNVGLKGTG